MNSRSINFWRRWRTSLVVAASLLTLFYAEENWRGRRAWENCKRALKAGKDELNWANYISAPPPNEQNVFGVPEMERWFKGGSPAACKDLTRNLPTATYPGVNIDSKSPRMVVAEIMIGRPGTAPPDGFAALRWDEPASRTQAARLLTNAIGPTAKSPQSQIGVGFMVRRPEELRPAKVYLECATTPPVKELQELLPDTILNANSGLTERVLKFEKVGDDSYNVTMPALVRAADYLTWSDGLGPRFALIRQALQRPFSRMQGCYDSPNTVPTPNFTSVRPLVQTLGARAQCHLLLGQPEEALGELTLIHAFCRRVLEEGKPMTLLAAMLNGAVRGLYANQIAEGLRLHAWRESQLAALEEQLKTINLLPPVKEAFTMQAVAAFRALDMVNSAGLVKRSALSGLCPRGWGYRRMAARILLDFQQPANLDTGILSPDKIDAVSKKAQALDHWSAYTFAASLGQPNFARACQRTARHQTDINHALIACALERYRLAHGEYPEDLESLVPPYLDCVPHDVIGGQTPRYHRAADGGFVLYSIGWSGKDHGGVRGQSLADADGDWVWPG